MLTLDIATYTILLSYISIVITLAMLAYRDIKEYILPDNLNIALALLFIPYSIIFNLGIEALIFSTKGALLGGGFMYLAKLLADKYYAEDSIGLGDVKLITAAGIGLGFPNIFLTISLGAFIGMFHGIILAKIKKQAIAQTQVPAGLGFTIAIFIVFNLELIMHYMSYR